MTEEWRDIPGYEGLYKVSNLGRVLGVKRGNLVKPFYNTDGYPQVGLSRNSLKKHRRIHSLVLEAFTGLCPQGHEARHLDSNKENCRLDNLEWAPTSVNMQDNVARGVYCLGRLTDEQVREIRTIQLGYGQKNAYCKKIGISRTTFHVIRRREAYAHVGD